MEFRFIPGDGSPATEWSSETTFSHTYQNDGHFDARVQVRDIKPDGSTSQVTANTVITIAPPPEVFPTQSNQIALDSSNRRVFNVNPDSASVTALDADTNAILFEVLLDAVLGLPDQTHVDPRSIALDSQGQLWVAAYGIDQVIVLNSDNGALVQSIELGYGAAPIGVLASPTGNAIFVSTEGRASSNPGHGQVIRFATSGAETGRRDLGPTPRAMAMTSDGNRLFVSRFISDENQGNIWEVNPSSMALTRTFNLYRDRGARGFDSGSSGKGVPNYVGGLAISPDNEWLWYAATKPNTQRGAFFRQDTEYNLDLTHDSTVRPLAGRINLISNEEPNVGNWSDATNNPAIRIDLNNSDSPSSITFSDRGDYVFVTRQGNNSVAVFDHLRLLDGGVRATIWRMPAGAAPQGILLDHDTGNLFVNNFMDRSLSVHPIAGFLNAGDRTLDEAQIVTASREFLSPPVLLGKQIFYHASDQMSFENYISCASCHFDGGHDGRTFDFTQRGEGLRNTTDLRGRSGMGHGNVHWTANFDEIQDFIIDIVEHQLGSGFLPEGELPNPPLGAPNSGRSLELDAMAAYVASLDADTIPRSPFRQADGSMTADAMAGEEHFLAQNCASCHDPSSGYTDSSSNPVTLHNVGTLRDSSGFRLGETLPGIDTPTLLGIHHTAPYFHDGSAETLEEVFIKAGGRRIQAEDGQLSGPEARIREDMVINMDHSAHGTAVQLRSLGDAVTFSQIDGGPGGLGAVELRYEAVHERTVRLVVNGTSYEQLVPGAATTRQWRRVFFNDVEFNAGTSNTLRIELAGNPGAGGNRGFQVDDFTVTTAGDRALAEPHRRVLNMPATQRQELIAYLLQLDGSSLGATPEPVAPSPLTHPVSIEVAEGNGAAFSGSFAGFPAPSLQWQFRANQTDAWTPINDQTGNQFTISAVQPADAGYYRLVASNEEGTAASNAASLTVLPPPPPPTVPVQGLVAEWLFEEPDGNTVFDTGPFEHHGTLSNQGVSRIEGVVGDALLFDGAHASVVELPSFELSGQAVTFSLFGRVDAQTVGDARFFGKALDYPSQSHTWMLSTLDNRRLRARLRLGNNTVELISPNNVFELGQWHHLAMIYDGSTLRILVDGETVASTSASGSIAQQPDNPVAIGNHPQAGARSLNGAIDQFRIYDRALTADEIDALVEELPPVEGPEPPANDRLFHDRFEPMALRLSPLGLVPGAGIYGLVWAGEGAMPHWSSKRCQARMWLWMDWSKACQ